MVAEAESLNIDEDKAENTTQIAEDEKIVSLQLAVIKFWDL